MLRLILAIVHSLIEEAVMLLIVLWVLPRLGVKIPLWGIITLVVLVAAYAVLTYRLGSRALKKELLVGLPDMIGSVGEVVSPLVPEGLVRIKGELWIATTAGGRMEMGEEVVVIRQERLKLTVQENRDTNSSETDS